MLESGLGLLGTHVWFTASPTKVPIGHNSTQRPLSLPRSPRPASGPWKRSVLQASLASPTSLFCEHLPGRTDVGTCSDRLHMLPPIHRHSDVAQCAAFVCRESLNILICTPQSTGLFNFSLAITSDLILKSAPKSLPSRPPPLLKKKKKTCEVIQLPTCCLLYWAGSLRLLMLVLAGGERGTHACYMSMAMVCLSEGK